MRKTMITCLLVVIVFAGMVLPTGQAADEAKPEVIQMSLQKSIELGIDNNIDLKKAKIDIDQQQLAYKQADYAADETSEKGSGSYQGLITEKFTPNQKQMLVKLAERSYEMQQKNLEIKIEQGYYNMLLKQKTLDIKKSTLDSARRQNEVTQAKLNQGLITENDALVVEIQLITKENEWGAAQREFEKAQMEFKQLLNLDINQKIELRDKFILEAKAVSLEDGIATALESRLDMLQARETEQLYALNVELAGKYYTPNVWTYKQAAYQYEQAKLDLEKQTGKVKLDVNKAYLDFKGAEAALQPAQKNIEKAKESLRLVNLRYGSGLTTSLDVLNAQNLLENMELAYANAAYAYTLSMQNFEFAVNHGSSF